MSKKNTQAEDVPVLERAAESEGRWLMLIIVGVSLLLLVLSGSLSASLLIFSVALGLFAAGLDYLRYSNKFFVNTITSRLVPILGYHLIYLLFILVVVGIGYPYIFLGLLLIFLSHLWYKKRGATISLLAQVIMVSAVYIINEPNPDFEAFAYFFSVVAILVFLSLFLSDIITVANKKIEELSTTSTKVKVEHLRINSLINSMGDGVIVTDAGGKIVNYNGAALDLVDTNESIGTKPLSKCLKLTDKDGKRVDLVADAKKHRRTINRDDLVLSLSKDDKICLYVNISPIRVGYGSGSEKGYTLILRDITSQKSLEEERDEFISVISHELRTPVTITEGKISNAMLTNKNSKADETIGKSLEEAHEQTMFLASMINDLSTLARAERGALDMEISLIEPAELMKEIQSNYKIEAEQKKLKLTVKTAPDLPSIDNSKLYVQEILQNFVTNSLKYTQKGSISISAKKGKKDGTLTFSVEDTGIGISTSDQKKLFDKFFRSEDYRTRESSGTGLGLHITQKLAAKVGGEIEVKSKLNSGSTFTLTVGSIKK